MQRIGLFERTHSILIHLSVPLTWKYYKSRGNQASLFNLKIQFLPSTGPGILSVFMYLNLTMKGQKSECKPDANIENAKKPKKTSKNKQNRSNNLINKIEEAFLRFSHLPEQIFEKLDNKSLTSSRMIGISWQNFIDERGYPWTRFKDVIAELNEKCDADETAFHVACEEGYTRIVEMILENSSELNIDLNAKEDLGETAFHLASMSGHAKIVEMLINNYAEFNIDLNAKDDEGWTAFHYACQNGHPKILELLMTNSAEFKIDLNAKNNDDKTGFQVAHDFENFEVAELIKSKMPSIAY